MESVSINPSMIPALRPSGSFINALQVFGEVILETILLMPDGPRGFEQTFIFINDFLKKPDLSGEPRRCDVFSEGIEFRSQRFISVSERHVRWTSRELTSFKQKGMMKQIRLLCAHSRDPLECHNSVKDDE